LLLSLSLLVITHEFGHFLFARLFKTRVRRFYLFFNWKFSILKAKKFDGKWHFLFFNAKTPDSWNEENLREEDRDNTLWGIGWIPLGGYCDIAGMVDETKSSEDMASEPQPWEYRSKKPWKRLCIISGGVLVNFLSALLLYSCIFSHWGKDELPMRNAKMGYDYHELLLAQGFQNGDIVYAIDGEEMTDIVKTQHKLLLDKPKVVTVMRSAVMRDTIITSDTAAGEPVLMQVDVRDTQMLVDIAMQYDLLEQIDPRDTNLLFSLRTPFVVKEFASGSHAKRAGMQIGDSVVSIDHQPMACFSEIKPALMARQNDTVTVGFIRNGVYDSVRVLVGSNGVIGVHLESPLELFETVHTDYTFFQAVPVGISYGWNQMVTYARSLRILFTKDGYKGLGGFGTLGSLFPSTWNWYTFWSTTALLALILAFMNVIPIPGLDGGHILFTLWEMITRRKPSDKFLDIAQSIGMALLLLLLIVANGNDILRIFK